MKTELSTPKAILIGLSLIAIAIASIPYSKSVVGDAYAASGIQKVEICGYDREWKVYDCVAVKNGVLAR